MRWNAAVGLSMFDVPCTALARAGDPWAVPALQALLAAETDSQVLAHARRALDKLAAAP